MNNKYFAYKLKSKKSLSVAWTFLAVFPHQVPELALWIFKPRPMKPSMQGLGASHPSLSKTEGAALKNQSKIYWEAVSLAVLLVTIYTKAGSCCFPETRTRVHTLISLTENAPGSKETSQFLWCSSQVNVQLSFCPPHRNVIYSLLTYKKPQCSIFNHIQ